MRTMMANAKVLGLSVGETFQSDDKFYDTFIKTKWLSVIEDDDTEALEPAGEPVDDPADPPPAEEPVAVQEPVEAPKRGRGARATE